MKLRLFVITLFIVVSGSIQSMADSGPTHWKFIKLVDTSTSMSEGLDGLVSPIGAPALSQDDVSFQCRDRWGNEAICGILGGSLTMIADTHTHVPDGTDEFFSLNLFDLPVSLDDGIVAFYGSVAGVGFGVYAYENGTLQTIADTRTPVPNGSSDFVTVFSAVVSNGNVAFRGTALNNQPAGIYLNSGGLISVLADTNTLVPETDKTFQSVTIQRNLQ